VTITYKRGRLWCSECGNAPNAVHWYTGAPPGPQDHLMNHIAANMDRKLLGIPERPLPTIEIRPDPTGPLSIPVVNGG
jgi:hypothetical protein